MCNKISKTCTFLEYFEDELIFRFLFIPTLFLISSTLSILSFIARQIFVEREPLSKGKTLFFN